MASILPGYNYDIFISYRQKDNKYDGWVTEFVENLKKELEATFKEEISVYFDINPHDGLLETHSVDQSLEEKLKCLIFIPVISRTYCDPNSFAWQHEFCFFNKFAREDTFGRDVMLISGNVTSRILPVRIHDLDPEDIVLLENELGGKLRGIEFIYKEPGVNRPLTPLDDEKNNLNKTRYRNQINKTANAVKEIITALKKHDQQGGETAGGSIETKSIQRKYRNTKAIIGLFAAVLLIALGLIMLPQLFKSSDQAEKSIAVLPFSNLSNDPSQEYFSDGIVEAILNHLFKVGDLKVISSTSTKRYKNTRLSIKEIARELGVTSILEGSVQKIGNNVRITAQLIDARTDAHIWSEIYDKDLSDIFSIQSEVAQKVASELKARLTPEETDLIRNATLTTNQLAYDFYLRGNDYFSKYEIFPALDMFSKAIEEDSLFTSAYAKRAIVHIFIVWDRLEGWKGHDVKAREDIMKGLQLDPESATIRFAEAVADYHLYRNYEEALGILSELKTIEPNEADLYAYTSFILRRQGKFDESINESEKSIQLDPFNATYIDNLALSYELLHRYDDQIECSRRGLSLIPDYSYFKQYIFSAYLDKTGDLEIATKESGLKEDEIRYGVFTFSLQIEKVAYYGIYYYKGQYDKLIDFIKMDKSAEIDQLIYHPADYELALACYLKGEKSLSKIYADSAILHLKEKIMEMPDDDRLYATLGKCFAFSGDVEEAIACGQKAVDLKPVKLDFYQGVAKEQDLMEIYIFTGQYDNALDKIEYLLSVPSWLSFGKLTIDPVFDKLRSLPRFQKIIENAHK